MVELTGEVPSRCSPVGGRPLREYKLDAMPDDRRGDTHHRPIGAGSFESISVRAIWEQANTVRGTTGAQRHSGRASSARDILKDRFLVMMGDDIYAEEDVAACIARTEGWVLLVQQLPEMHRAGNDLVRRGHIADIVASNARTARGRGRASRVHQSLRTRHAAFFFLADGSQARGQSGVRPFHRPLWRPRAQGIPFEPVFTDNGYRSPRPKTSSLPKKR